MVKLPLEGGCACGAMRYEVRAAPVMVYSCHCTNCQRIGGGAFTTSVTVPEPSLVFTRGEPARTEWTSDAGNRRWGWFCKDCGSRICNGQVKSNGMLSVRSGTLDDKSWIESVGDIWTKSAQPWVKFVEGGVRTEKGPSDYAPFIERFRAQGRFSA